MAMIAMTTRSSISVNPRRWERMTDLFREKFGEKKDDATTRFPNS
jgi:hypothetical protein